MTPDQHLQLLHSNLTNVQVRCTELLEENRALKLKLAKAQEVAVWLAKQLHGLDKP